MNNELERQQGKHAISIFYGTEVHHTSQVNEEMQVNLVGLEGMMTQCNWCPATFKEDERGIKRRTKGSLKRIAHLVLDIDDGCTLEDAKAIFKDYCCIIATTRNHQKEKSVGGGKTKAACDRFRVILILERDIFRDEDFKATWFEAARRWSFIDHACKDSSRFFYPCVEVVYSNPTGLTFPITLASEQKAQGNARQLAENSATRSSERGRLSWRTQDFLLNGADPWHSRYHLACVDLKEQCYSIDEARDLLERATENYKGYLDEEDERQLNDVYAHHVPKYPPRPHDSKQCHQEERPPFAFSARLNDRSYTGSSPTQRMKRIEEERAIRIQALKNQVPFVCNAFDGIFSLTMGLNLIGACTGGGKTTTSANILAYFFLHHRNKQVLVITNEETAEDVINRVACVLLEVNFLKFRKDALPEGTIQAVEQMAQKVAQRIEVVDKEDGWDMTCLEDVQAVLEYAMRPGKNFGLIAVDYLQTVAFSRKKDIESIAVSKHLGHYLKEYGRRVPVPVVVFSQLHPDPQKAMAFSDRFQNDKTIVNHAVAAIEVVPDCANRQTTFIIHKDRFGELQKVSVPVAYREGRFTRLTESILGSVTELNQAKRSE